MIVLENIIDIVCIVIMYRAFKMIPVTVYL